MNIWLIKMGETLPIKTGVRKMRTAILADKLIERGHSVLWWTSAFDHFKKDWVFKKDTDLELTKNIKIKFLKGIGYKKNISVFRYIDHRIIATKFRKTAPKTPKPDIIIASIPSYDLAYEAVTFAKENNIPILVDIRDQQPDIFLNHVPPKLQRFIKMVLFKDFLMVKKTMQMADGLIAMTNTLLEWGLKYANRQRIWKDEVFYLGYKRSLNLNNKSDKILKFIDNLNHKFVVVFIGGFGYYHNPSILIQCATKLAKSNICFVLAGSGELFKKIKNRASTLPNVILPGWLNQDEITILLDHSHVGICPTTQIADFFPNKAFLYLSAGLPIISAFQGNLREIIKTHKIGFYYPPNDVDVLVGSIQKLHDTPTLYKEMSENAIRVFAEMFNADKIYEGYSKHIENVVKTSMDKD